MPTEIAARASFPRLLPLFLVSMAAIGTEIALTRFFAIASWSEYGYWVISMTMVGLAASGIVASLLQRPLLRHAEILLPIIPPLLIVAATLGWHWTTIVPFNPLELQNRQLWADQLWNIAQYYAALFPFFFLVGLYITLYFMVHSEAIGRVYNVTGPDAVTIEYYIHTLAAIVGAKPRMVYIPREQLADLARPVFPFEWRRSIVYDIKKAQDDLAWRPRYDFASGMRQTYAWFQESGIAERVTYDFIFEDTVLARFGLV